MIDIEDLAFRWRSEGSWILNIRRFHIDAGERIFLQGPSGSGKTSLLNLLGGIATPQEGRILLLGQDLTAMSGAARDRFRADHLGLIFQNFNLVPYLSLRENVALPCLFSSVRRQRADAADGGVATAADRLLSRMNIDPAEFGGRPVTELSTGQQQRVAAARAIVGAPEIVIADEPTSALDGTNTERFIELLMAGIEATGTTLVFVSHDDRLATHFDRTVLMDDLLATS